MAIISVQLKLAESPFFFFRGNSVKKNTESYSLDTTDAESINAILRGVADGRIISETPLTILQQLISPSSGGGGDGGSVPGLPGESAYEIARRLGKTNGMSESEWIDSLVGKQGPQGPKGADGKPGTDFNFTADPLSAYNNRKAKGG